jgi:hypothetical protein
VHSQPVLPPYALPAPVFPFRHLASLASRAPIGGAREVALACFVVARLAADRLVGPGMLPEPARTTRCVGARSWIGTLSLPTAVRTPLAKVLELSGDGSGTGLPAALLELADAAAPFLDPASRGELDALALALGG